jgi:hypothetical protein
MYNEVKIYLKRGQNMNILISFKKTSRAWALDKNKGWQV